MRSLFKLLGRSLSTERGNILVLFGVGLTGFLGLVGMSADVGHVVYTRTDLQKVADAAAFAAAQDLPNETKARATANEYVAKNGGASTSADITFSDSSQVVRVVAKRHVKFWFAPVVGVKGSDQSARAAVRSRVVTGYEFDDEDVFPYAVWGGNPNPPPGCPYGVCPGAITMYRDNAYRNQVKPNWKNNPNWQESSNTFKGYFHHGTGITQINPNEWQTFSNGGNATGQGPIDALHEHYLNGKPIILPVISAVRECNGNTSISCPGGDIQFKIVAWVAVRLTVDPLNVPSSVAWEGEVVSHYSTPMGDTTGSHKPPSEYEIRTVNLIE